MLKCLAFICLIGLTVSASDWEAQAGKRSQRMNLLSKTIGARMLAGTNGQMDTGFQPMMNTPTTGNQQFVPIARQNNAAINSMQQQQQQPFTGSQTNMDSTLNGGQQLTPEQLQQLHQFLTAQTQSQQQTSSQFGGQQPTTQSFAPQTQQPQQAQRQLTPTQTQPTMQQQFRMTDSSTGMNPTTGNMADKTMLADQQNTMNSQFGQGRMVQNPNVAVPFAAGTPDVSVSQASKPSALEQQLLDQQILTQKLKEQLQQQQSKIQQQPGMQQPGMQQPGMQTPGMQTPGMQQPGMQQPGMQTPGMQQPGMQQPGMQTPGMQQPGMQQPGMQQPGMQTPVDQTTMGNQQTGELTSEQKMQRMTAQQQQQQQQQLLDQINRLNQLTQQGRMTTTPTQQPTQGVVGKTVQQPVMPVTNSSRMMMNNQMMQQQRPMVGQSQQFIGGSQQGRIGGGDICAGVKAGELLPHPLDETQFIVCNELGEITLMDCPNHTVFNPHLKLCDLTSEMPLLCKANPCLNGAKCVEVSPIQFRCECPQGFSGKTCEKFDTCQSSKPCGADGVCLSFALGSPIPHVCLCNGGRSVGLTCDRGEQNPCTVPGSSTKLMPVNFNRAVFAHCEGARPHFKFCQPPLMFSGSKQACEWTV